MKRATTVMGAYLRLRRPDYNSARRASVGDVRSGPLVPHLMQRSV
jgi:hypothetical protein